jgi:flagellar basal body-associated protein FliL
MKQNKSIIVCMIIIIACSIVQISCTFYGMGFRHGQNAAKEAKP